MRANTHTLVDARLVPQRAVSELQGGYQVRVVGGDSRIATRAVTVGDQVGRLVVVSSGLEPGERVAVDGAQFVKDGAIVTAKPFVMSAVSE